MVRWGKGSGESKRSGVYVESDVGRGMADGGGAVQIALNFARLGCGRDVEVRLKDIET